MTEINPYMNFMKTIPAIYQSVTTLNNVVITVIPIALYPSISIAIMTKGFSIILVIFTSF